MTHTAVVGVSVTAVAGLRAVVPEAPPWAWLILGGLLTAAGFAGLWLRGQTNGDEHNPP